MKKLVNVEKNLHFFSRENTSRVKSTEKIADEKVGSFRLERIEEGSSETDWENKKIIITLWIVYLKLKGQKTEKVESSSEFIDLQISWSHITRIYPSSKLPALGRCLFLDVQKSLVIRTVCTNLLVTQTSGWVCITNVMYSLSWFRILLIISAWKSNSV